MPQFSHEQPSDESDKELELAARQVPERITAIEVDESIPEQVRNTIVSELRKLESEGILVRIPPMVKSVDNQRISDSGFVAYVPPRDPRRFDKTGNWVTGHWVVYAETQEKRAGQDTLLGMRYITVNEDGSLT